MSDSRVATCTVREERMAQGLAGETSQGELRKIKEFWKELGARKKDKSRMDAQRASEYEEIQRQIGAT